MAITDIEKIIPNHDVEPFIAADSNDVGYGRFIVANKANV